MKLFTFLFLFFTALWSADIDTRLYEGNNTIAYYEEVSKLIDREEPKVQADTERIDTERMILEKLVNMTSFTSKIHPMPDSLLPNDQNISMENYLSYLNALTDTYATISTLKAQQDTIPDSKYYPPKGAGRNVAIMFLGGSDGGLPNYYDIEGLTKLGYPCFIVGYFATKNTPERLEMIPLEYFEEALKTFKSLG